MGYNKLLVANNKDHAKQYRRNMGYQQSDVQVRFWTDYIKKKESGKPHKKYLH